MIKGKMVSDEVDSDEESGMKSNKKGKKKEKQLTPEEAAHEEYLCEFPTLHARSSPSSLFLLYVDFETGDYVEVTPSKIHDILGIPVGGISLFSLVFRPIKHEFVRSWVDQFYPKSLKEIRVGDIASKSCWFEGIDLSGRG
ncbi:hypothetical protein Tco_1149762 [Tanacetum coccineum]